MGKGSVEIKRDIEHQRRALSDRIDRLDGRIRGDVEDVRGEVDHRRQELASRTKDQLSKAGDGAAGPLATVREKLSEFNSKLPGEDSAIAQRPNSLLFGSFAAGLVAGIATGGGDDDGATHERRPSRSEPQRSEGDHQQGGGPGLVGKGMDSAKGYLGAELSQLLREFVDDLKGKGDGKDGEGGGIPGMLKSAWDSMSSKIDEKSGERRTASHVEMHERDLPRDRPLSDLEERTRDDLRV